MVLDSEERRVKIVEEVSITWRCADDTIFPEEGSNDLKLLLKKAKEESATAGLHMNIKKTKSWLQKKYTIST